MMGLGGFACDLRRKVRLQALGSVTRYLVRGRDGVATALVLLFYAGDTVPFPLI
jgi:hypothetical protein